MAAADALQQAPVEIPGFRLVERLHSSAPRVVYRAVRLADGRDTILKTLAGPYPSARDVAELRHEFHVAQKLDIDGVIRVHGLVPHGVGNVAIEMEPFGLSLADLMATRRPSAAAGPLSGHCVPPCPDPGPIARTRRRPQGRDAAQCADRPGHG
jgi:hypothetical protein